VCEWTSSVFSLSSSYSSLSLLTLSRSPIGGLSIIGGSTLIKMDHFSNNSPLSPTYPSIRRNLVCSGDGEVEIESFKGGDGSQKATSMWMIKKEGCEIKGIGEERNSTFFIPSLINVISSLKEDNYLVPLTGTLFLPCSFSLVFVSSEENDFFFLFLFVREKKNKKKVLNQQLH
jgi:hypothetical protein